MIMIRFSWVSSVQPHVGIKQRKITRYDFFQEVESEQMRPLAREVIKTLEKVRCILREQCLSPTPHYTEDIRENLKIFDRLFSEFEFAYISCREQVNMKTKKGL